MKFGDVKDEGSIKADSQVFGMNNWLDGITIYQDRILEEAWIEENTMSLVVFLYTVLLDYSHAHFWKLKYIWHKTLYKFKVYSMFIWYIKY